MSQLLTQYFLDPLGLLALFSLIPVIIFYLTRPRPERKVMPSIRFFQEEDRNSKLRNAFNRLKSNLVLLINILFVILSAAAIAGLYLETSGSDETVIIYDTSADMQNEHAEAVSTIQSEASTDNTVIVAGETVKVFEDLNRQEAVELVRKNEPGYHDSDMRAALDYAQGFDGEILLLSNLDESQSVVEDYEDLGGEKGLQQIDYSSSNDWGFVSASEDSVEIRNYKEKTVNISLGVNSESQSVSLQPGETKEVDVNLENGRNDLQLSSDGFEHDNKAYLYKPEDDAVGVEYHGSENRFIETALDEIPGVEQSDKGDILVLNEEDEDVYSDDRPKILMQGSADHWAEDSETESVEFQEYNLRVESRVYDVESSNKTFSSPEEALFRNDTSIYYNFEDEKLREEFVYPIVWKDLIYELEEPRTFESVNKEVQNSDRSEPGFYGEESANYLDENALDYNDVSHSSEDSAREPQFQLLALLLLLIISAETLVMLQRGAYQ